MNTVLIWVLVMTLGGSGKAIHSVEIGNLEQCNQARVKVLDMIQIRKATCIPTYREIMR